MYITFDMGRGCWDVDDKLRITLKYICYYGSVYVTRQINVLYLGVIQMKVGFHKLLCSPTADILMYLKCFHH